MNAGVEIVGGGPAGASAAIAALREGAAVRIWEQSSLPRHKVCGEFLSPETAGLLEELGVWNDFESLKPAPIERVTVHIARRSRTLVLPERGYGLSRYELDRLLLDRARALGACVVPERAPADSRDAEPCPRVIAAGRRGVAAGERLFGFKAHFTGAASDAIDLFFFEGCYVGVGPVENSTTNICGIAPERLLREHGFDPDPILRRQPALRERVEALTRGMRWLTTGPLIMARRPGKEARAGLYLAGDALGFTDPFTGSGLVNAITTGAMAGRAAARGESAERYAQRCQRVLGTGFQLNALARTVLASRWAEWAAPLAPLGLLFRATRPGRAGAF